MTDQPCALCQRGPREADLRYQHHRHEQRVSLQIGLCAACARRMEKHLKRMVPKRLMQVLPGRGT